MYPNIGAPGCTLTSGQKLKAPVWAATLTVQGLNPRPYCLPYCTHPYAMPSLTSELPVSVVSKPRQMNSYIDRIHMNSFINRRDTYEFILYQLNLQK